jgi:competence protein ComEC
MSYWSTSPFIRLTIFFIAGILYSYQQTIPFTTLWITWSGSILAYTLSIRSPIFLRLPRFNQSLLGITALTSFFLAGSISATNHQTNPTLPLDQLHPENMITAYTAVIVEESKRRPNKTIRVTAHIQQIHVRGQWQPSTSKVLLYLRDTGSIVPPSYGDILLIRGSPQPTQVYPNNKYTPPMAQAHGQPNYQHFITHTSAKQIGHTTPHHLQAYCLQLRKIATTYLSKHIQAIRERSIIQALVLGIKDTLDANIQQSYAATGTMHVLAVSGLHVGILYTLLRFLFFIRRKSYKPSNLLTTSLTISLLWLYAGVTGLSPSVCRATIMLSLVAIAQAFKKKSQIYNALAASAFLILAWNPSWLFSISFQLSYGAVIGIIYLQPRLYQLFTIKNPILRKLWLWTTVSLAAQGATTLLQVYYFHQFPLYFIIANWIVVPAAFCIFTLGVLILLTTFWDSLNNLLSYILEKLTWYINESIASIAQWPHSVIDNIYLTPYELYLYYSCAAIILVFLHKRTVLWLGLSIILTSLTIVETIKENWYTQNKRCLYVHQNFKHTTITLSKGAYSLALVDQQDTLSQQLNASDKSYTSLNGRKPNEVYTLQQAITNPDLPITLWNGLVLGTWGKKRWAIINKPILNKFNCNKKLFIDYVIISNNSLNQLQPLLEKIEFEHLIIDRSNSKRNIRSLQKEVKIMPNPPPITFQKEPWIIAWQETQ